MKFIAENCVDPDLRFEVSTPEPFDLDPVPYGSLGTELFSWVSNTICLNFVEVDLSSEYPSGTWGVYSGITCEVTGFLWAGFTVFKFEITEAQHSIPGLIIEYYIVYNGATTEWEMWEDFDPITGPSCPSCCDGVDRPYLIINSSSPITNLPLTAWTSTLPDPLICTDYNPLLGVRDSFACEVPLEKSFIDCWKFIPFEEGIPVLNPNASILIQNEDITFYEDCEDCLEIKNEPPCIKLTDCITGEETIISFSETLESYVGKVIKLSIPFNGTFIEACYTVSYSLDCPEEPTLLPGTFIACFETCETCLPKCICTRALNSGESNQQLSYIDCDGELQQTTEDVVPGKYSLKYCVTQWADVDVQKTLEFGECINEECPVVIQPKKFIAPGYDTPVCTPSYYEKIVCKYSEIKYVETVSKRYGLDIKCDDEDSTTAIIKFELLQMQILNDPDYDCQINTCPSNCSNNCSNTCSNTCSCNCSNNCSCACSAPLPNNCNC